MHKARTILSVLGICLSSLLSAQIINVAFLGNSYTGVNNLPNLLQQLALSGGDSIYVDRNVIGGYSLAQHVDNTASIELIREGIWDFVVLQEQSQHPTIPYYRDNFTFPAADSLNELIQLNNPCANTVFYMTWGRKYGGQQCIGSHCSPDFVDYFHMQDSLESAYMKMAFDNDAFCSPVGISWSNSISNGDPIELFTADLSHPSLAGSYLAACTFYIAILNKSPHGLEYTAGLSQADAGYLQQLATFTVLSNPEQWNIFHPEPVQASFSYEITDFMAAFTNASMNATEYLWNFGDPLSGLQNTSTLENPSHEFTAPGTYVVSLKADFQCLQEDIFSDSLTILETSLSEEIRNRQIIVFPNPARSYITIMSDWNYNGFCIVDELGKIHISGQIGMQKRSMLISTSTLAAGIYFLHLSGSEGRYSQKILIR